MARTLTTPDFRQALPKVHGLGLSEEVTVAPDRVLYYGIRVMYLLPTFTDQAGQDIWVRDSTAAATKDWIHAGRTRQPPYVIRHPDLASGRTYTVAVAMVSALGMSMGPDGSAQASITLGGVGAVPSNVTGFAVAVDKGDAYFTWTALSGAGSEDVLGYEIRSGATGWLSATRVAVVTPRERDWLKVPRAKATGTSFYIKALTTTGVVSDAVATATLTAARAGDLDASSAVRYQDVTVTSPATTVTVTTKGVYTAEPFITATQKQSGATVRGIYKVHVYNFVANGDSTYSFTLRISDAPPANGSVVVTVLEAGG